MGTVLLIIFHLLHFCITLKETPVSLNHGDGSSDHFSFATFLHYSERDARQSCKLAN